MKGREEKASEGGREEKTGKPCERVIKSTPSVNITYSCLITSAGGKNAFFFLHFVKWL